MFNRAIPLVLVAAVWLLSSSSGAWAVPTVQAQVRPPDAAGLMREAQRLSREGSLTQATVSARAAMEAGRQGSGGAFDFTELEAGDLLVDLLHKQGRYDEARRAAEEQIAYWEQQTAAMARSNRRDPRITSMLGRAIEASMMAGEKAHVARLQEKLFAVVRPDPGQWRLSSDEPRLRYNLADFSMPLTVGQWKLTKFQPAEKRDSHTLVLYTQALPGSRLSAEISLSYDENQRKVSAAERQAQLSAYRERHTPNALEVAMPDLAFDGLTAFKRGEPSECEGEECINVHWLTYRGDWRMDIDITFGLRDEAQAAEQMRQLFCALNWHSAPPLFRERPMARQIRDIEVVASLEDGVAKAAELAKQALPDAHFSAEIALLQTYIGVSQYQRADFDAARQALGLAVPAWEETFSNEILYRSALDHGADIAYRQGRSQDAVALNRKLIEWQESDATLGWAVPKDENALVNNRKGVHLPLRVGDYRLRPDTQGRFYYENLQTGAQLGLTVGMPVSSDQELESTLRSFMSKNLNLQAAGLHKTTFSPRSAVHGAAPATGHKWEFEVSPLPEAQGSSSADPVTDVSRKTPTKMAFWIVDRNEHRSMLRAPVTDSGRSRTEADQIAQALSW
jgi:tetratricopeptide (TPR) repeat protein